MMAGEQEEVEGAGADVVLSWAREDQAWADRLRTDLGALGIRVSDAQLNFFDLEETIRKRVEESRPPPALVVLWSPAAMRSDNVEAEAEEFSRRVSDLAQWPPRIVQLVFGHEAAAAVPEVVPSRRVITLSDSEYRHVPSAEFRDAEWLGWVNVLRQVVDGLGIQLNERSFMNLAMGVAPSAVAQEDDATARYLDLLRVQAVGRHEMGWMIAPRLAILLAGESWPDEGRVVSGGDLYREAVLSRLRLSPEAPFRGLPGFVIGRLSQSFADPTARWAGAPRPGAPFELWSTELTFPSATGELGAKLEDGSFKLEFSKGVIENGSAVWDPESAEFLGVAVLQDDLGWRLITVATLRELAEQAEVSTAMQPLQARMHNDGWTLDDELDYRLYAASIAEFISHRDTKAPLVIGIQGPWGQGKTSLMRQIQNRLDPGHPDLVRARREKPVGLGGTSGSVTFGDLRAALDGTLELGTEKPATPRTVWFNPWKYQSSEALWAGMATAILGQLPARLSRRDREVFWLRLQAKRIDPGVVRMAIHRLVFERALPAVLACFALGIFTVIACATVGLAAVITAAGGFAVMLSGSLVSWVVARRKALQKTLEGNFLRYARQPDYSGKLGFFHYVDEDMHAALELLAPDGEPTVVFIDDLDRCSAGRIGEVIEAINLFLAGDYPNCYFVLGIDAGVVAGAMATVHAKALGENGEDDESHLLGWRFLDKFIQLSFVMPRLTQEQRSSYLGSLLGLPREETDGAGAPRESAQTSGGLADAVRSTSERVQGIREQLVEDEFDPDLASIELGQVRSEVPVGVESEPLLRVAEEVIERGAREFRDTDPNLTDALSRHLEHLSNNPRTIKRAVNLYRFYYFLSLARSASMTTGARADADLLADWAVVGARWPEVVNWVQVHGRRADERSPGNGGVADERAEDLQAQMLGSMGGEADLEMRAFFDGRGIDLARAGECGLW